MAVSGLELVRPGDTVSVVPVGVVEDAVEVKAGEIGGFYQLRLGSLLVSRALMGRQVADVVRELASEEMEDEQARLLATWPDVEWAHKYKAEYKLVAAGEDRVQAVKRMPGLTACELRDVEGDVNAALVDVAACAADVNLRRDRRAARRAKNKGVGQPVVELAHVLNDGDYQVASGLSPAVVQLLSRIAAVDAPRAAAVAQRYLRNGGANVIVKPGTFARGAAAARQRLLNFAESSIGLTQPGDIQVVTTRVVIQADPSDGGESWSVEGPNWHFHVVLAVAWMVQARGAEAVATLFATDLVQAGITVLGSGMPLGYPDPHVGVGDRGEGGELVSDTVVAGRLQYVATDGGDVTASGIWLHGSELALNTHVAREAANRSLQLHAGEDAVVPARFMSDLCVADMPPRPVTGALTTREARVGEAANLYSAIPGGTGMVEDVGSVVVRTVDPGAITTSLAAWAREGCSGGALVAASDGALLGMYHGSTRSDSVYVPITDLGLGGLGRPVPGVSQDKPAVVGTYGEMVTRGLGERLATVAAALVTLTGDDGKHCGTGLSLYGGVMTTLDVELWGARLPGAAETVEHSAAGGGRFVLPHTGVEYAGHHRQPERDELLVMMGKAGPGDVFLSQVVRVATAHADGRFSVSAPGPTSYALTGAVLVAVSDAAVVGLVGDEVRGPGGRYHTACTLAETEVSARRYLLSSALTSVGVDVRLWTEQQCRAIVLHDTVAAYYKASADEAMGDMVDELVAVHGASFKRLVRQLRVARGVFRRTRVNLDVADERAVAAAVVGVLMAIYPDGRVATELRAMVGEDVTPVSARPVSWPDAFGSPLSRRSSESVFSSSFSRFG